MGRWRTIVLQHTAIIIVHNTVRIPSNTQRAPLMTGVTLMPAGTPATPRLVTPLGGKVQATFTIFAVPTAIKYTTTVLKDGAPMSPEKQVAH